MAKKSKHVKDMLGLKNGIILCVQLGITVIYAFLCIYPIVLMKDIVDLAIYGEKENIRIIINNGCWYLLIQWLNAFLGAFSKWISGVLQADLSYRIQECIFEKMCILKLDCIKYGSANKLSNTLIQDTLFLSENLVKSYTEFVSLVLKFLFGVYFVSKISFTLILAVFPLGVISSFIIKRVSSKTFLNLENQRIEYEGLWKNFNEGIKGFITLRLHKTIWYFIDNIKKQGEKLKEIAINQSSIESKNFFVTNVIFMTTIGCIMMVASIGVVGGKVSIGGLTAIMMYNHMLTDPLINLQEVVQKIQKVKVAFGRINEVLNYPVEEKQEIFGEVDELTLKNIDYAINNIDILKNVNCDIKEKESLLITGTTGCGKSTLVNIISGIYRSNNGTVEWGWKGKKISYKPRISYMMQDEYLFDMTIEQNILIGSKKIGRIELKKIIEICRLKEIIENKQYNIGENGNKLSGGERKRILIARTLADKDANVYVFDEMSASLDERTFLKIWEDVDKYLQNKIRIYIEHNLVIESYVNHHIRL